MPLNGSRGSGLGVTGRLRALMGRLAARERGTHSLLPPAHSPRQQLVERLSADPTLSWRHLSLFFALWITHLLHTEYLTGLSLGSGSGHSAASVPSASSCRRSRFTVGWRVVLLCGRPPPRSSTDGQRHTETREAPPFSLHTRESDVSVSPVTFDWSLELATGLCGIPRPYLFEY